MAAKRFFSRSIFVIIAAVAIHRRRLCLYIITAADQMIGLGILPDEVVLASMIDGHCKERNSTEATTIFRSMVGKSILPEAQNYNAFKQGFSKNQKMEQEIEEYGIHLYDDDQPV